MKLSRNIYFLGLWIFSVFNLSCKKDFGNLNSPTAEDFLNNASKAQLDNLVTGTESAMRINLGLYLDDVGVVGREMYRFSTGDPRYTTDLLGASDAMLDPTGFYLTNAWSSRYRVVKNCDLLIEAAGASELISDAEKKGYAGFAKTFKAHQLLLNLNLTDENGIRTDVANPDKLGSILGKDDALQAISSLLDQGRDDLANAEVSFPLSSGFAGFNNAEQLQKVNRALAARVAAYRKDWTSALTAVAASFFDLQGDLKTGVYHIFGTGSGDQINPAFFPRNQAGDVRLAHPSFADEIEAGDDRLNKAALRSAVASYQGLSSNRDVWVYTSSTAPVAIVRNEELILLYAEANIQLDNLSQGEEALNVIRNSHQLGDYSGGVSKPALIDEMLRQRRYSLFFEIIS